MYDSRFHVKISIKIILESEDSRLIISYLLPLEQIWATRYYRLYAYSTLLYLILNNFEPYILYIERKRNRLNKYTALHGDCNRIF